MKRKNQKNLDLKTAVINYGADILDSREYKKSNDFIQHGDTTTHDHMISAALVCLKIARALHLHCDEQSLVRGALLHDYFLYDWHAPRATRPPRHPTRHGTYALKNAAEIFTINPTEAEMLTEHMFPLTLKWPHHKETWILTIADKACSFKEAFTKPIYHKIVKEINDESNH